MSRPEVVAATVGGVVGGALVAVAAWVAYAEKVWGPRIAGQTTDAASNFIHNLYNPIGVVDVVEDDHGVHGVFVRDRKRA